MSRNAPNGENGEKRQRAVDSNWMPKVVPWRVAILAKLAKLAILAKMANLDGEKSPEGWRLKLDGKSVPLN